MRVLLAPLLPPLAWVTAKVLQSNTQWTGKMSEWVRVFLKVELESLTGGREERSHKEDLALGGGGGRRTSRTPPRVTSGGHLLTFHRSIANCLTLSLGSVCRGSRQEAWGTRKDVRDAVFCKDVVSMKWRRRPGGVKVYAAERDIGDLTLDKRSLLEGERHVFEIWPSSKLCVLRFLLRHLIYGIACFPMHCFT